MQGNIRLHVMVDMCNKLQSTVTTVITTAAMFALQMKDELNLAISDFSDFCLLSRLPGKVQPGRPEYCISSNII